MKTITDKNYSAFIATGKKVLICTAGYCKVCKLALRKIEDFPQSGIINLTDQNSVNTMRKLKIRRVPTVIYYRDGKELFRAEGTTAIDKIDRAWMS